MSMYQIPELRPNRLWYYFNEISKIPRTSLDEDRVINYIAGIAEKLDLETRRDSVNNLIVFKKAVNSNKDNVILTLQSHVDMVGVKRPETNHDFSKDPISLTYEEGYVKAKGTTLGADNGIGVALMMALMEEDFDSVDLEFLFTINEESGMTGARNLSPDFLKGRMLLNLDSEEWGYVYVSCAGASDSVISFPKGKVHSFESYVAVEISVEGLLGGHSGIEIHSGKRNSNKLLARILRKISAEMEISIHTVSGGTKRNAIPAYSKAVILVKEDNYSRIQAIISEYTDIFRSEFGEIEKKLSLGLKKTLVERKEGLSTERSDMFIKLLMALPNGVSAMSPSIEGLVETSTNLGVIESTDSDLVIRLLSRSSIDTAVDELNDRIGIISELCGASVEILPGYPGWKPNLDSKLLNKVREAYNKLYGNYPEIKAIHAGLETAIIGKKFDNMDMVSIGPDLFHPHSPDEKVCVETVEKLFEFTKSLIRSV